MSNINPFAGYTVKKYQFSRIMVLFVAITQSPALFAHAQLMMEGSVPPRYDSPGLKKKNLPCGASDATATPTNIKTILDVNNDKSLILSWKETVDHPGHFLFDFAEANDNFGLVQEIVVDGKDTITPDTPLVRTVNYTLPGTTCENCTIRLRQTMYVPDPPDPEYDPKTDTRPNWYFSCADIAIVDKTNPIMPSDVSDVQAGNLTSTALNLSWTNPPTGEFSEIVVVRKTLLNSMTNFDSTLNNFTHYPKGGNVNGDTTLTVVYRGASSTFNDTGLQPETSYGYEIFARNADYNYNLGSMQVVTTLADSGAGTGDSGTGNDGGTTPVAEKAKAGSLFAMLLVLIGFLTFRRVAT